MEKVKLSVKLTRDELEILRTYRLFTPRDRQVILDYFRQYYAQEIRKKAQQYTRQ